MSFDNLLVILLLTSITAFCAIWLFLHWKWLPIVLLIIVWFIPRQAVPNGILEKFLYLRWLTVILIPLVFIIQLFKTYSSGKKFVVPLTLMIPLGIISLVYLFSGIINNVKTIELIGSLILYVRYPLLFLVFINIPQEEQDVKKFLYIFIILIILQIPECLYRFFALNVSGDFLSFTLGPWGAFDLGVYTIYAVSIIVAYNIIYGFKLSYIVLVLLLFIIAVLAEIKAFVIAVPLISLIIILYSFRNKIVHNRLTLLTFVVVIAIALIYIYQHWGRVHRSSGNMIAYYFQIITDVIARPSMLASTENLDTDLSTRFLGSAFIFEQLKNSRQLLLLGAGPGSLMAGSFTGSSGKLYNLPTYLNQLAVIIGEVGILGLIAFVWLLFNIFRMIRNVYNTAEDNYSQFISLALLGMWFFYAILGPFYDLVWRHDSSNLIFWFLFAMIYRGRTSDYINNEIRH